MHPKTVAASCNGEWRTIGSMNDRFPDSWLMMPQVPAGKLARVIGQAAPGQAMQCSRRCRAKRAGPFTGFIGQAEHVAMKTSWKLRHLSLVRR